MKKILLHFVLPIILAIVLAIAFFPIMNSTMSEKEIIEKIESFGVRVEVVIQEVYRGVQFHKVEENTKLTDEEFNELTYKEKIWYEDGFIVEYGEWIVSDKTKPIYGSGAKIFSGELPKVLQTPDIHGETLVITNYHVIEALVEETVLGSKTNPIDVYDKADIETSIDPPKVKVTDGARPIFQKYFYLVDAEKEAIHWEAITNTANITVALDQNYKIKATVIAYEKGLDVAILRIKNVISQPYARFRETVCIVGEKIWLWHAPLGIVFSLDRGYVNMTHLNLGIDDSGIGWEDQVKTDVPAVPGSSGSAIYDENALIIALHHGSFLCQISALDWSYVEGGHLAHEGTTIAAWMRWQGFGYIFLNQKPHPDHQKLLDKVNIE